MATGYGSRIVTDGLVLCLDAANRKSYPGTGTAWYDLSGNGNDATLVNGVTYTSDYQGGLTFDGADDYGTGSTGILNAPFTFSIMGKFNSTTSVDYEYLGDIGEFVNYQRISISKIGTQFSDSAYHGYMYVSPGNFLIRTDIDLRNTDYQYITVVALPTAPYLRVFKNGLEGTVIDNPSAAINTNGNYSIGKWGSSGFNNPWYLDGHISQYIIHNRALTAEEIAQNFQALRGRYGI